MSLLHVIRSRLQLGFNPCFAGSASVSPTRNNDWQFVTGFNPCFAGSASVRLRPSLRHPLRNPFQSLFCWKCLCELDSGGTDNHGLVFQSLFCWKCLCETRLWMESRQSSECFNPCFAGSASVSAQIIAAMCEIYEFQSLFCWKCLCEAEESINLTYNEKFQSLFCWKCLCEAHTMVCTPTTSPSFNPCFAGSASVRRLSRKCQNGITGFNPCFAGSASVSPAMDAQMQIALLFQSLFCWKCLCEPPLGSPWNPPACFNPCFAGSASVRHGPLLLRKEVFWFQSLFCWKCLCELTSLPANIASNLSFNPCFAGSASVSQDMIVIHGLFSEVSILVLLEVPL